MADGRALRKPSIPPNGLLLRWVHKLLADQETCGKWNDSFPTIAQENERSGKPKGCLRQQDGQD